MPGRTPRTCAGWPRGVRVPAAVAGRGGAARGGTAGGAADRRAGRHGARAGTPGAAWPFTDTREALTPAGKAAWLASAGTGVYVDDQAYVILPCGWRFVQYTGQDADDLMRLICP